MAVRIIEQMLTNGLRGIAIPFRAESLTRLNLRMVRLYHLLLDSQRIKETTRLLVGL